ncbi:methylenetetrahydrofolate reductase [Schaalia suimastitidis]|uniref:methylenetetrahydrofolate reductase n=1 Tax=Schaalia suimastitidis TaxID=121163 RepID=UPI0003F8645E|nr:methylenetetrahydrofolate reductase [Schaalia suimastitidis]
MLTTSDLYASPCRHDHEPTLVSFEVMPPRKPEAAPQFWLTVDQLIEARPDFMSVTYGAGGKDRSSARAVVDRLVHDKPVTPIAHLTCVGTTRDEVVATVADYLDSGVRTFLALRGDPPQGQPDWQPPREGVHSATQLIHLIRTVEARRCAAHPGEALRAAVAPLAIAVATFPAGNPAAGTTQDEEIQRLLVKQAAGASFAITQLFWEADIYLSFVDKARQEGVGIPIVAGVLPPTDPARLHRVAQLTGVSAPNSIIDTLAWADTPAAQHDLGVGVGARLVDEVLDGGAPGVHLYTFNRARPALDILTLLGRNPAKFTADHGQD